MRTTVGLMASLAVVAAWGVERVDSVNYVNNIWQPRTWSTPRAWREYLPPQGGGIASFSYGGIFGEAKSDWSNNNIEQNVDGLQLRGLDFQNLVVRFHGKPLTFVSDDPYISTARTATPSLRVESTLQGDGSNALAKKGGGRLVIDSPVQDFTSFDLVSGTIVVSNHTGAKMLAADGVDVKVKTGALLYSPTSAGGATVVGSLVNGAGLGTLSLENGGTLTAENFSTEPGGVLAVSASGLGSSEKFIVSDKTSCESPDGGMVALSGNDISFLDYDASVGWKAGTGTPANAVVFGMSSDAANTVIETGGISFDNEGYVWRPAAAGATTLKVTGELSAPGGITFASAATTGTRPSIDLSAQTGITTPLRFVGVSLDRAGITASTFAPSADVAVYGDPARPSYAGTMTLNAQTHKNDEFNFTLRLAGAGDTSAFAAENGNWEFKTFKQKGRTILEGDTTISSSTGNLLWFNGPIEGRGGLRVQSGYARFYNAANAFVGDLRIMSGAVVSVWENGALGAGDVLLESGSRLYFTNLSRPLAVTNYFTGTSGTLAVQKGSISLAHRVRVAQAFVQNGASLALGADFAAEHAYLDMDSTICATNGSVELRVGASSGDDFLTGRLVDGADGARLSLVKTAASMLTICGTNNAYGGETRVDGGTLRLGGGIVGTDDIAFWGDASDASTLTIESGRVKEWRSKVGTMKFTGDVTSTATPAPDYVTDDATYNGHVFLRFTPSWDGSAFTTNPKMDGNANWDARTVFIVCRTQKGTGVTHHQAALINYNSQDLSLRVDTSGGINAGATDQQDLWATAGYGFENGVRKSGTYIYTAAIEGANLVTLMVPRHVIAGGGYNHYSTFTPMLGSNGRPWAGDLCELIVFKRALTDAERCTVENYLMAKWNPSRTTPHTAAQCTEAPRSNILPTNTDLRVACGATLDLNGSAQTVANLFGEGRIVNSSTNAAMLTVTGGGDFHGSVSGNVTLILPTGSRGILLREGARLVVAGAGESALTVDNPQPPMHDLAFWLDASHLETLVTNASGEVVNWLCREAASCAVPRFRKNAGSYPTFVANGWNEGKPAVFFNDKNIVYTSATESNGDKSTDALTLFYVVKPVPGTGTTYSFGPNGRDIGMTISPWNGGYTVNCRGPSLLNMWGDLLRINGEDKSLTMEGSVSSSIQTLCYVMRASDAHKNDSSKHLIGQTWCIGSHSGSRAVAQYVAEIIGYTKQLTEAEILTTEKYLLDKWMNSGTEWPAPETEIADASSGLGVANGATVDLGVADATLGSIGGLGGTIRTTGTLTLTESLIMMVVDGKIAPITLDGNLAIGPNVTATIDDWRTLDEETPHQSALTVTGTVTGNFASSNVGHPWKWSRSGNSWFVGKSGLTIILR